MIKDTSQDNFLKPVSSIVPAEDFYQSLMNNFSVRKNTEKFHYTTDVQIERKKDSNKHLSKKLLRIF